MLATMSPARSMVRRLIPARARHDVATWLIDQRVARSPDRRFLRRVLLPALAHPGDRILLVGCRRYNAADPALVEQAGATCWTIDIDPTCAGWGAPGRHLTAPIQAIAQLVPAEFFDVVVLSGVFGFGVNAAADQQTALAACAEVIRHGGLLALGWNTDRTRDPAPLASRMFEPACLPNQPPRMSFAASTHVFDLYRRRAAASGGS